jgi:hypothetical protein
LTHKRKINYDGLFDYEEHAAMTVNLICDKIEMNRMNPMLNIHLNAIQQKTKLKVHQYATEIL